MSEYFQVCLWTILHIPGQPTLEGAEDKSTWFLFKAKGSCKDIFSEKCDGDHMKNIIGTNQGCGGLWIYGLENRKLCFVSDVGCIMHKLTTVSITYSKTQHFTSD